MTTAPIKVSELIAQLSDLPPHAVVEVSISTDEDGWFYAELDDILVQPNNLVVLYGRE